MKYLLVTGGVISGLGKGITASSLGVLLQTHGCKVTAIKIDPYLNQDSGTLSPFEHGECFVLADGGEADLDLGSYERFLGITLSKDNNITTGKIYRKVLEAERRGDYLGATVQIVPQITDSIIEWIDSVGNDNNGNFDVCILELGGTVGDIESLPFLEALRQMKNDDKNTFCHVHVSYLPVLKTTSEIKTKPTQESVKDVRRYGIDPNFLCLRCEEAIPDDVLTKIHRFCGLPATHVLKNVDVSNIYSVPLNFSGVIKFLWNSLRLRSEPTPTPKWETWKNIAHAFSVEFPSITVGIVGKYSGLRDSYLSLCHAIKHAAVYLHCTVQIKFIESSAFELAELSECNAVIIPGGFGQRGIEGMVRAVQYTREKDIPTLGICLGMQVMIIEWTRNVLAWTDANSMEFNPNTKYPVLIIMDPDIKDLGGSMRLGSQSVHIRPATHCREIYSAAVIAERHRHRYEVNPKYHSNLDTGTLAASHRSAKVHKPAFSETEGFLRGEHFAFSESGSKPASSAGAQPRITGNLKLAAFDETKKRVEMIEHDSHKFYIGCQFHPEYQTYPGKPHPLFINLIRACCN